MRRGAVVHIDVVLKLSPFSRSPGQFVIVVVIRSKLLDLSALGPTGTAYTRYRSHLEGAGAGAWSSDTSPPLHDHVTAAPGLVVIGEDTPST